nr:hypothetical protein Iba_chr11bCG4120 [Ipomoea batatas]GMD53555.1 hypothetical protein Iba_chr11cCG3750 [Ipomoea batatas]GMD54970.1 hypothetical protein Iba_chr11dCG3400 [Ipomoea batatas]GMD56330.1 hypothetical protein Iba_chr11eCG2150 [Ipomoea batatas]
MPVALFGRYFLLSRLEGEPMKKDHPIQARMQIVAIPF